MCPNVCTVKGSQRYWRESRPRPHTLGWNGTHNLLCCCGTKGKIPLFVCFCFCTVCTVTTGVSTVPLFAVWSRRKCAFKKKSLFPVDAWQQRWVCFGITLISKGLESFTYKRKDRMFLLRTESEDASVACVWWDSVVPQFNDTPGLVLCLEVKAARHAPPHGLRPLNHGGAFFRAERDGVWVTYERPNKQSAETTWSKKRKERETVNKPFGMAAAQTARMCSNEIIRWCQMSQAHGKTSSRVRKWRRGLRHFQAGLHQGHGVCTFLFEKATFHKWHIQQKFCPHWKKLSHEEFYHILVKARRFFGSPAASLLHNLFWSTNTFTVLFFFWQKK